MCSFLNGTCQESSTAQTTVIMNSHNSLVTNSWVSPRNATGMERSVTQAALSTLFPDPSSSVRGAAIAFQRNTQLLMRTEPVGISCCPCFGQHESPDRFPLTVKMDLYFIYIYFFLTLNLFICLFPLWSLNVQSPDNFNNTLQYFCIAVYYCLPVVYSKATYTNRHIHMADARGLY